MDRENNFGIEMHDMESSTMNMNMQQSTHTMNTELSMDDLETHSLMRAERDGPMDMAPTQRSIRSIAQRWRAFQILVLLSACAALSLFKEDILNIIIREDQGQTIKIVDAIDAVGGTTLNLTAKPASSSPSSSLLISLDDLRSLAVEGKQKFQTLQVVDYGEYAETVFDKEAVLGYFRSPTAISRERLKRSLKIKILQSQVQWRKDDDNADESGSGSSSGSGNGSEDSTDIDDETVEENDKRTTFVWAVGGHSAAAGHGNLFKQAYANIIEESLKPIFASMGIRFYAKNYAMGGTKTSPEVSLCMESIFGPEVDILSWDYAMTDGRSPPLYNMWLQRANLHPSRPILFSFGQRYADSAHQRLEADGGAGFERNFLDVRKVFPDSDDLTVNATTLTPGVKDYLCNKGHIETGEPCGDEKFHTSHMCKKVGYQTSWHNGWKDHMFIGRLTSAFIIENLLEAVEELFGTNANDNGNITASDLGDLSYEAEFVEPSISLDYLNYLHALKREDQARFHENAEETNIFEPENKFLKYPEFNHFQRSRGWCRTALLPSQARYDGVVTENNSTVTYLHGGRTDYKDEGETITKLSDPEPENDETQIHLAYNIKLNRNICEHAEIDFKDTFFVRAADKWMQTTVPNDSELAYFDKIDDPKGIIALCSLVMDWNRYPKDYVTIEEMVGLKEDAISDVDGDWGIIVNGKRANNLTSLDKENRCYALKHNFGEEGHYFPKADNGRYKVQFRVPRNDGNFYFSSIMVL